MSGTIILTPQNIPVLSKTNAKEFHNQVRERILETEEGLFEYVEAVKFFANLEKQINGDSQSKIEADKELIDLIRTRISEQDNKKMVTKRGVTFTLAEVGSRFDFSKTNDPVYAELNTQLEQVKNQLKEREEFLKSVPPSGMDIRVGDELVTVYPPSKSSKSTFKVQFPK